MNVSIEFNAIAELVLPTNVNLILTPQEKSQYQNHKNSSSGDHEVSAQFHDNPWYILVRTKMEDRSSKYPHC